MADLTDRPIVVKWLGLLGVRCAPTKGAEDVELRVRTFAAPLAADLPPWVFCDQSLEVLSRQFEFFPAYASLRKALDKWMDDNRPPQTALPGADDSRLSTSDRIMLGFWNAYRGGQRALPSGVSLTTWLSMLRKTHERLYRYLARTDLEAAAIIVRHGWEGDRTPLEQARADWNDPEAVRESLRRLREPLADGRANPLAAHLLAMLRALVGRHAPHNLALLPDSLAAPNATEMLAGDPDMAEERGLAQRSVVSPDALAASPNVPEDARSIGLSERAAAFERAHGRKPGALSPEQLAALRANDPILARLGKVQGGAGPHEVGETPQDPAQAAQHPSQVRYEGGAESAPAHQEPTAGPFAWSHLVAPDNADAPA